MAHSRVHIHEFDDQPQSADSQCEQNLKNIFRYQGSKLIQHEKIVDEVRTEKSLIWSKKVNLNSKSQDMPRNSGNFMMIKFPQNLDEVFKLWC